MPPIDPLELNNPGPVPQPMPVEGQTSTSIAKLKKMKFMLIGVSIVAVILLVTTLVFAAGASTTTAELDAKYAAGVEDGKAEQKKADVAEYNKATVSSTRTYTAPVVHGSFEITYPKAWNLSIDSTSALPVDGLVDPGYVNLVSAEHALKFTLQDKAFESSKKDYDDLMKKGAKRTEVTVSGIKGYQYVGKINEDAKEAVGTVVIVPLRDKTMLLQTDSNELYADAYKQMVETAKLKP
jgi:hypothetical protein